MRDIGACCACVCVCLCVSVFSYSAARAHGFPRVFGLVNSRGAPWGAHLVQGLWVVIILLVPISNFHSLINYFGFGAYMFCALWKPTRRRVCSWLSLTLRCVCTQMEPALQG